MDIERAIAIALKAHQGQYDKGGHPYILHPLAVMNRVHTVEEKMVAVLHDVVEDSDITLEELRQQGFGKPIVDAVELLTKSDGDSYEQFIAKLSGNELARQVKIADIHENKNLSRIPDPTDEDRRRLEKYERALRQLGNSQATSPVTRKEKDRMNTYGELCTEVYELSKPVGFSYGDVEYYKDRLQQVSGRVLEVACGSGRVMIPLMQHGILIEGIDNSQLMLDACRRNGSKAEVEPILHQGEMNRFQLDTPYEAIIIPGGSIQLLDARQALLEALQCFHTHLEDQGVLILDTFIPADYRLDTIKTRMWETAAQETITLEEKRIEVDFIQQRILSLLRYDKWKDGRLTQSELQRLSLSWYGVDEFRLLLESAGFTDVTVTGNYQAGSPPTEANGMITYEARKG